ncbi:MAG: addiction module protein [Nitrospirota bacterium]|nr:addiction module protein [Nitrospirota bacterium]
MNTKLRELPIDELIKLVEELWDSIASDQKVLLLTDDQKAERDRRLDTDEVDRNRCRIATEPIADIRREL